MLWISVRFYEMGYTSTHVEFKRLKIHIFFPFPKKIVFSLKFSQFPLKACQARNVILLILWEMFSFKLTYYVIVSAATIITFLGKKSQESTQKTFLLFV